MREDTRVQVRSDTAVCPFLGMQERDGTRLCRAQRNDPILVGSRYIDEYCLTSEHKSCSLFLHADAHPTTAALDCEVGGEEHRGIVEGPWKSRTPDEFEHAPVQATRPEVERDSRGATSVPAASHAVHAPTAAAGLEIENVPIEVPSEEVAEPAAPETALPVEHHVTPDRQTSIGQVIHRVRVPWKVLAAVATLIVLALATVLVVQSRSQPPAPSAAPPVVVAPAPGYAWSLPPGPAATEYEILTFANPAAVPIDAEIRAGGTLVRALRVPPRSGSEVALAPPLFARTITIYATGPIAPGSIVTVHGSVHFTTGRPVSAPSGAGTP